MSDVEYWKKEASDWKSKYVELDKEFNEYQTINKDVERELEMELEESCKRRDNFENEAQVLRRKLAALEEEKEKRVSALIHEKSILQSKIKDFQEESKISKEKVTALEVENDKLHQRTRILDQSVSDLSNEKNQIHEAYIMLQTSTNVDLASKAEQIERLRQIIREYKDDHYAIAAKDNNKLNVASEMDLINANQAFRDKGEKRPNSFTNGHTNGDITKKNSLDLSYPQDLSALKENGLPSPCSLSNKSSLANGANCEKPASKASNNVKHESSSFKSSPLQTVSRILHNLSLLETAINTKHPAASSSSDKRSQEVNAKVN